MYPDPIRAITAFYLTELLFAALPRANQERASPPRRATGKFKLFDTQAARRSVRAPMHLHVPGVSTEAQHVAGGSNRKEWSRQEGKVKVCSAERETSTTQVQEHKPHYHKV